MSGFVKTSDRVALAAAVCAALMVPTVALAHGDVAPQAVDVSGLPELAEGEVLTENPYRAETAGEEAWAKAVEIGASGYVQNCARCHGLEAISGGLAPDLRFLEAEEYGDEWYIERFIQGYTQGGVTKMPAFGEVLGQEAGWAIRTYVETRPDGDQLGEVSSELGEIRDTLQAAADGGSADSAAIASRLTEIGGQIETMSGAPVSDNIATHAGRVLAAKPEAYDQAAEILTVGLSVAH
ncbi:cytochrome c-550 PedF [Paracoccus tegillarcae]|uniref:Cytochrome c-550 PedF n=1 Tax=Paracoccus tegillarcae TaxID=1529068 RepID=A0A2K9EW11_9RHOB|nr:cytochrome c-550 PedF [Paracoccus tegillarcae]AUH33474.1 cytochrome c-550 PedF [Paracoccus tegillarcae]